ncbi:MAG: transposase [Treponema sp.]|jgi:hypothetical protein|nr:transposase [Treponema sp.]
MAQGTRFNREEEFEGLDFHSLRLENRFVMAMETLIRQPDASIWEASGDRVEAKSIYRMPGNESFDQEEIVRAHREAAIGRMAEYGGAILAARDAAGVNYNTRLKMGGGGGIPEAVKAIAACDREGDMAD